MDRSISDQFSGELSWESEKRSREKMVHTSALVIMQLHLSIRSERLQLVRESSDLLLESSDISDSEMLLRWQKKLSNLYFAYSIRMKTYKTGDSVIVIASKHKGAKSTITHIDGERVFLDWVNVVKRAKKGEGYIDKTLSIHISNIAHYDEKSSAPSRVKVVTNKKWKKERVYVKSGAAIA